MDTQNPPQKLSRQFWKAIFVGEKTWLKFAPAIDELIRAWPTGTYVSQGYTRNVSFSSFLILKKYFRFTGSGGFIINQGMHIKRLLESSNPNEKMMIRASRGGVCHAMVIDWLKRRIFDLDTSSRLYNTNKLFAVYSSGQFLYKFFSKQAKALDPISKLEGFKTSDIGSGNLESVLNVRAKASGIVEKIDRHKTTMINRVAYMTLAGKAGATPWACIILTVNKGSNSSVKRE